MQKMYENKKTPIKVCKGTIKFLSEKFKCSRATIWYALNYVGGDTILRREIRKEAMKDKYIEIAD